MENLAEANIKLMSLSWQRNCWIRVVKLYEAAFQQHLVRIVVISKHLI